MKLLVAALHGIMNGGTAPTWPVAFERFMLNRDPEVHVVTRHYFELPFPRINWIKNRWLARQLTNELALLLGKPETTGQGGSAPGLWFVGHSNGTVIAWLTAKALIARGYTIGGMILTGAALEAHFDKNRITEWVCSGHLGRAVAYSSKDDAVVAGDAHCVKPLVWKLRDFIWGAAMWPYGCLGRSGWQSYNGDWVDVPEIYTRWFAGGHSCYFREGQSEQTFDLMYQDMGGKEQGAKGEGQGTRGTEGKGA